LTEHKKTPASTKRSNIPRDSTLLQICKYLASCGQAGAIKNQIKTRGAISSMSSSDVIRNIRILLDKEWIYSETVETDKDGIPGVEKTY